MEIEYIPEHELKKIRESEKSLCNFYLYSRIVSMVSVFNCAYIIKKTNFLCDRLSFSSADILSWLWTNVMKNPNKIVENDICDFYISSNGQEIPFSCSLLITLGKMDFENIHQFRSNNLFLSGGISKAKEIIVEKRKNRNVGRVYVLIQEKELLGYQIWKDLPEAVNKQMYELVLIVVRNFKNSDEICLKFRTFGLMAEECNGHSFKAIDWALTYMRNNSNRKPQVIVVNTMSFQEYFKKDTLKSLLNLVGFRRLEFEKIDI